jgi:integrase/recombinase XerD
LNKETAFVARHSFATFLKRSGVSTEFISEALGHSDLKTTKAYLARLEEEMIHETTNALTAFK